MTSTGTCYTLERPTWPRTPSAASWPGSAFARGRDKDPMTAIRGCIARVHSLARPAGPWLARGNTITVTVKDHCPGIMTWRVFSWLPMRACSLAAAGMPVPIRRTGQRRSLRELLATRVPGFGR